MSETSKTAVACITAQPHCVKIIEAAKNLAGGAANVVAVTIRSNHLEPERKTAEDACLTMISNTTGVKITEIFDEAPLLSLVDLIEKTKPFSVFTGKPGKGSNFVGQLALLCGAAVSVVSEENIEVVTPDSELEKEE